MVDAQQATQAVVDYFRTVAGAIGPIGFSVEKTERSGDEWVVFCSYFVFLGARSRTSYRVEVDAESGAVARVETLPAP
jgi:hypothetical protein